MSSGEGGSGRRRALLWVFGVPVGLLLVGLIVGMLLPVEHQAGVQATLPAPAEAVWQRIRDIPASADWRPNVERFETLEDRDGRPAFTEHGDWGPMSFVIDEDVPNERLVTRIIDEPSFGGTWTFELEPVSEGSCRITITEDGTISNPFFRVLSRFVFGYSGNLEKYLAALEAAVGPGE